MTSRKLKLRNIQPRTYRKSEIRSARGHRISASPSFSANLPLVKKIRHFVTAVFDMHFPCDSCYYSCLCNYMNMIILLLCTACTVTCELTIKGAIIVIHLYSPVLSLVTLTILQCAAFIYSVKLYTLY